ncbi:hypothetical protein [Klebsiella quasipneumoniae]|uniref:hypothetical protein n=1 Tax=Klebsiella quasipneumoniae TaxID=1463165 RepID=UPI0038909426|nr:hypothetical protein [Klebsiella quasipneumoniae subsp. similipneumoniae]HCM7454816.1 hypothetical protein [Klebsiella quasipneumoniae]
MTNNQLTDERITSVIERLEHYACNLKWTNVRGAQDLLTAADGLRELQERRKAAMDSEPTIANCDPEVYEKGVSVCLVAIPKETAEIICQNITAATGCKVDWHYFGGRVHIKALRVTSQPAPVVPEEMTIRDACKFVQDMRLFDDVSVIVMRTWNACRAAMLQELKKSAGTEAICRSNENVQAVEVQSLTSINPAPDLVSLQKKAESIIGNYPGIPDAARDALEKALTAMEFMGDTLNNLDAVCSEDVEFVTPAFDAVRRVLAAAQQEVKGE